MQLPFFKNIKSPHIKKYAANTGWLFADNLLRQLVNLFVGIYVARYLLPEGLGKLSYATTYVQLIQPLAHVGLTAIIIRELVKGRELQHELLGTGFYFKLVASCISFAFIIIYLFYIKEESPEIIKLVIIATSSILISPFQVIDFYFQATVKSKYVVYAQQISTVIIAVFKITGVYLGYTIEWFVWLFLFEIVLVSLSLIFYYNLTNNSIKNWVFSRRISNKFLLELWPVIFSGFFVALYMKIDQLMIFNMLGDKELGIYHSAVKLCEPFYVVATILCSSLFPAIITGLEISRAEYEKRLQSLFDILTWIAIFVSLVVHFFSHSIIGAIYGIEYFEAESVLRIYFWASLIVFQGVVAGQAYATESLQKFGTIYTLIGAIMNILLNLILIPWFGVDGAAIATLISYLFSAILLNLFSNKTKFIFYQQMYAFVAIFKIIKFVKKINDKRNNS